MHIESLDHRSFIGRVARESNISSMLEVGVREGDSVLAVIDSVGHLDRLALCDDWGLTYGGTGKGSHNHIEKMLGTKSIGSIDWLDGKSSDWLPKLNDIWDLVHIDGDHSREGCLFDLRNGWKLTLVVMVVHDIFMLDVWWAVSTWLVEVRDEVAAIRMSAQDSGTIAVWRN